MSRSFGPQRFDRFSTASRHLAGPLARFVRRAAHSGLRLLLAGVVVGLAAAMLATLLAREWWVFDLATHFRVHYVAVAMLGVPLALLLRRRAIAIAIVVLVAPHAVALTSFVPHGTAQAAASEPATPVRVTTINAFWANWDGAALVDYVEQTDPDILVVQEAGHRWQADLLRIGARFPYAVPEDWRQTRDVIVFSRFPATESRQRFPDGRGFHYQTADLEIAGRTVTLVGVHPPSPVGPAVWDMRNRYFSEIARFANAAADRPLIIAGDFNSTVWSPHFVDLIAASGLGNAADGRGWRPTWPTWLPAAGIQIDHILVSEDFTVQALDRGPDIGSDHFPLTADLALR